MKIEAVVPCVGFADLLAQTLPENLPHLPGLVVVTSPDDGDTRMVCGKWGVRCLVTGAHRRGGASFDRSAAINYGLEHCGREDWLLVLDADIALPCRFTDILRGMPLSPARIYGVDRVDCDSPAAWADYRTGRVPHEQQEGLFATPAGWPPAKRCRMSRHGGWFPMGFFQLWHAACKKDYASAPGCDADRTDVLQAIRWPREDRVLIPDLYVIHLKTSRLDGEDWHGRKSPPFIPAPS